MGVKRLDQAIDPNMSLFNQASNDYFEYLKGEYNYNFTQMHEWRNHFEHMRAEFNGAIMNMIESGVSREDMNIAILGPGMKPVGRDFGLTAQNHILPKIKNLVVVDFAAQVIQSAIDQIRDKVQITYDGEKNSILGMQFDITDGLSTAYTRLIKDELASVETEHDMYDFAKKMDQMTIENLQDVLVDYFADITLEKEAEGIGKNVLASLPPDLVGGEINKKRTLSLSVDKEPLPVHCWYLPMVIAGTGAAAEHIIWDRVYEVTELNKSVENPDSEETRTDRQVMIANIHHLISNYNTIVAHKAITDILKDNPDTRVLAISDTSTVFGKDSDFGRHDRLDVPALRTALSREGIVMKTPDSDWKWKDEPEHYHGVNAFTCFATPAFKEEKEADRRQ